MNKHILKLILLLVVASVSLEGCFVPSKGNRGAKKTSARIHRSRRKPRTQKRKKQAIPTPVKTTKPVVAEKLVAVYSPVQDKYIQRYGLPTISLVEQDHQLVVTIKTKNLEISSVTMQDVDNYYTHLFSQPAVMKGYAGGKVKNREHVEKLVDMWSKRWQSKNPYSALAIRKKSANPGQGEFVGHAVLGHSTDGTNDLVLAGLAKESIQNKGYGKEVAGALVLFYTQKLSEQGYKVPGNETTPVRIVATAATDNQPAIKILEALGFQAAGQEKQLYGNDVTRNRYEYTIKKK